uniref:Uncharacterized protein n=1 Tax=Anguilla anguilla TaxID=7936 RepID=A0A0E9UB31_ANGAN
MASNSERQLYDVNTLHGIRQIKSNKNSKSKST